MTPTISLSGSTGTESAQHTHTPAPGFSQVIEATSTFGSQTPGSMNLTFTSVATSVESATHVHTKGSLAAASSAVGTVSNSPVSIIQPSIVVNFAAWYE